MTPPIDTIRTAIPRGRDNARHARDIAADLGMSERVLRKVISDHPALHPSASPGDGIWWPDDIDDIHATDTHLTKQLHAIARKRRSYRQFWRAEGIAFPRPEKK